MSIFAGRYTSTLLWSNYNFALCFCINFNGRIIGINQDILVKENVLINIRFVDRRIFDSNEFFCKKR